MSFQVRISLLCKSIDNCNTCRLHNAHMHDPRWSIDQKFDWGKGRSCRLGILRHKWEQTLLLIWEHKITPFCSEVFKLLKYDFNDTNLHFADKPKASTILQTVKLPIVDIKRCLKVYKVLLPDVDIDDRQLCVGGDIGKDSCGGDSGGPMMKVHTAENSDPLYYLLGIVSFGVKHCGQSGEPGIYTAMSKYLEWILDNLSPWTYDLRSNKSQSSILRWRFSHHHLGNNTFLPRSVIRAQGGSHQNMAKTFLNRSNDYVNVFKFWVKNPCLKVESEKYCRVVMQMYLHNLDSTKNTESLVCSRLWSRLMHEKFKNRGR